MIYLDADFIWSAKVTARPVVRSLTGYGKRIPTQYMLRLANNRWYRVYAACFSNAASFYITTKHAGDRYLSADAWDVVAKFSDRASLP